MNDTLIFVLSFTLTFLVAGLVKGVSGMGLPTVAMGLLGTTMPPAAAAALLFIPSIVTNVWQLLSGPATVHLVRRLWPMMVMVILGTIAGAALLAHVDPLWSAFSLGAALVVYAVYSLCAPSFFVSPRAERWLSPIMGLATGAVTGATGVFAIPAVPYLQSLGLERDELVQALGLSFTVSTVGLGIGLVAYDAFQLDQLGLSAVAIAPALIGMWLGQKIRGRISPKRFRQGFLVFLAVLGLELMSRPFV